MKAEKHVLFVFVDGVGLGRDEVASNPFTRANTPCLDGLLGPGWYATQDTILGRDDASLAVTDALLRVPGRPQSATGQAALLTGRNVPREIGRHYGPKPTPEIAAILNNGNLFCSVRRMGGRVAFLNPYPPRFFEGIQSGRRLLSAFPHAATAAGLSLLTEKELNAGRAVSPDLTGEGWRRQLGFETMPVLTAYQAGERLAQLAKKAQFTAFEHWPTDFAGHRQEWDQAVELIERLDAMVAGIVARWRPGDGLVLITSDHGNLEDLSVRTHTLNPVPTILIGDRHAELAQRIQELTDVKPVVLAALGDTEDIAEKK